MIIDKKLSFIPHVKYIKSKCYETMKLLTVLVYTDWGADKDTLLKLYRTLDLNLIMAASFMEQQDHHTYTD